MRFKDDDWEYVGEIDDEGLACGQGILSRWTGDKYEGGFVNDMFEGIGKQTSRVG